MLSRAGVRRTPAGSTLSSRRNIEVSAEMSKFVVNSMYADFDFVFVAVPAADVHAVFTQKMRKCAIRYLSMKQIRALEIDRAAAYLPMSRPSSVDRHIFICTTAAACITDLWGMIHEEIKKNVSFVIEDFVKYIIPHIYTVQIKAAGLQREIL